MSAELSNNSFGDFVGGLPGELFVPGLENAWYETGPNEGILCNTTSDHISFVKVVEGDDPVMVRNPYFRATVQCQGTGIYVLQAGVRNRRYDSRTKEFGKLDAHIYPAKVFEAAIRYLDHYGEHPITWWRAHWYRGDPGVSDNYAVYTNALRSLGEAPYTEKQKVQAAFGTWSGRMALAQGFRYLIHWAEDSEGGPMPLFSRVPPKQDGK